MESLSEEYRRLLDLRKEAYGAMAEAKMDKKDSVEVYAAHISDINKSLSSLEETRKALVENKYDRRSQNEEDYASSLYGYAPLSFSFGFGDPKLADNAVKELEQHSDDSTATIRYLSPTSLVMQNEVDRQKSINEMLGGIVKKKNCELYYVNLVRAYINNDLFRPICSSLLNVMQTVDPTKKFILDVRGNYLKPDIWKSANEFRQLLQHQSCLAVVIYENQVASIDSREAFMEMSLSELLKLIWIPPRYVDSKQWLLCVSPMHVAAISRVHEAFFKYYSK